MYGLHQAPRAWYGTLSKYLLDNGFQRGTIDQTLFIRKHKGEFLLVQVYVDDIIFGSSNLKLCREFEALMHDKFKMSAMGELSFFLGLQVLQKKDGIFLSQDKYVGDILKKFGFSDLRSMIGSLMYLTASRPDIMFASKKEDRKSTTGGCQFLGRRLISWQCKKQTICGPTSQRGRNDNVADLLTKAFDVVDFLQASHIRYALTVSPTVYVSHIRQFWSTARIETADGETNILAKINGKQRTISESSIRRHLKLNDEEGISTLPDNELFENLSLMGYNILPNQRFSFQKGQFSCQWKFLIHTIMQCLSPKSTSFNEFSSNIATALVCLATNRTYNFSKMIFDGMMRNVKSKGKFLMYPRFIEKLLKMSQFGTIKHSAIYPVPFQTQKVFTTLRVNSPSFSGRTVPLFDTMIVQQGEGSENQLEPHHTPSTQHVSPPHPTHTSSPHEIQSTPPEAQTTPQASLPHTTNIPSHTPTPRRMTKRAIRISQSKALSPVADETAPPTRGDRYGEAFPTATSLDAGQDRENIPKTSAMPHESFPRVTSLGGDEGSLKQKLKELMEFCTTLQSQQTQMAEKIQSQDLEIKQLKARIQTLEDAQKPREGVQEDAPNRGGIDQGEVNVFKGDAEKDSSRSTNKGSESTRDLANVLSSIGAANILTSGVLTTARDTTPYTRRPRVSREVVIRSTSPIPISIPSAGKEDKRKGKEIMTEPEKPAKAKVQEQISLQLARELQEEFIHEDQSIREQIVRDAKIARIHAEEDLRQMIDELDMSNVMINKHMAEYEEVENDLTIEEKTDLIIELINYQNDFARIKEYQAQ
ncbi:putative ribonuclease H-like domain-containing protein [Tanacetum coccineum]